MGRSCSSMAHLCAASVGQAQAFDGAPQLPAARFSQEFFPEETASAAEQLRAQSQSLRRLTVGLHELVEGAVGPSAE